MKRMLVLCGAVALCGLFAGCASHPQDEAIGAVISRMTEAAGDITNIAEQVDKAVDRHNKDKKPLDLTEADKMTEKLKDTAKKAQELKVKQIEQVKVGEEERAELVSKYKTPINNAFKGLLEAKTKLNTALQKAEPIDHDKVEELRTKIREAEGPFETLAR